MIDTNQYINGSHPAFIFTDDVSFFLFAYDFFVALELVLLALYKETFLKIIDLMSQ